MIRSNMMKPIIVYTDAKDGYVTMSKELFERYINEAYQAGKEDNKVTWNTRTTYDPTDILRVEPYRSMPAALSNNGDN